jgi:hypothetical protein
MSTHLIAKNHARTNSNTDEQGTIEPRSDEVVTDELEREYGRMI